MKKARTYNCTRFRVAVALALVCLLAAGLVGCVHKNVQKEIPPTFFEAPAPSETRVIIEPGDELTVKFYYHPEFDSTQIVRTDGKISLTLFQGIDCAGETPEEFQSKLVGFYAKEFVDPVITVEINKASNSTAYVTGEVNNGGMKLIQYNMTVGTLLAQSSVNEVDGNMSGVVLVRKMSPKEYIAYQIDARFDGGKDRDLYVKSGDIVYVPRNGITLAGDFVRKYIRDIVPFDMYLTIGDLGVKVR